MMNEVHIEFITLIIILDFKNYLRGAAEVKATRQSKATNLANIF